MEDKKLKEFTKLGKISITIYIIGLAIIVISMVIASFKYDTLIGIAVSGILVSIFGISMGVVDTIQQRDKKNKN